MIRLLKFVTLSALTSASLLANSIQVVGSDLMAGWLKKAVAAHTASMPEAPEVEYALEGSLPAISQLRVDGAHVGILAIPRGDDLPAEPLTTLPIGFKVSAVYVHRGNPIGEITVPRLAAIFSNATDNNVEVWGDLGLSQEWTSRSVAGQILAGGGVVSDALFRALALNGRSFRSEVGRIYSEDALEDFIEQNPNAIAVGARVPRNAAVRIVPVARTIESSGYPPSETAVFFNDYPLALPFYVTFDPASKDASTWLIRYMLSDDFARELKENGFVPVPSRERQRMLIELGQ